MHAVGRCAKTSTHAPLSCDPSFGATMSTNKSLPIYLALLLAGCGPDAAITAATNAKLQAAQLEQAKAQEAQFKNKLDEAMRAAEAAASAAGNP